MADQHHAFRHGNHAARLRLTQAWDLEPVRPLFNVPAAVAFGKKVGAIHESPPRGIATPGTGAIQGAIRESPLQDHQWPLPGRIVSGELSGKNVPLAEAAGQLAETNTEYWLSLKGSRSYFSEKQEKPVTEGSPYGKKFAEGATIVPRSFWFVGAIRESPLLGVDLARPYVKTDPRAVKAAKEKYQDVRMEGNVEAEFLYSTLLSTDLVPFGHLPFRTVVLPILWKAEGYVMLTATEARKQGYLGLAEWLERAEKIWAEKRGEKADRVTVYDWLDYRKKLTQQRRKKYTVLYPDVNRVMFGSVIDNGPPVAKAGKEDHVQSVVATIIESAMYYFDTDSHDEAFYLVSWLNSLTLDGMLQAFRRKAQGGHPHVHKKLWEFPIPAFNGNDETHRKLAALGVDCISTAAKFLGGLSPKLREGSLGRLRNLVREALAKQLDEIDEITRSIL